MLVKHYINVNAFTVLIQTKDEKAPGETQTLRAGRSKAEPKIFAPPQTSFPEGAGRPKFNQLENGDGHYLHLQTQFGEHRRTQFRVIVVTDTARSSVRPPATNAQTGPITIYCAAS